MHTYLDVKKLVLELTWFHFWSFAIFHQIKLIHNSSCFSCCFGLKNVSIAVRFCQHLTKLLNFKKTFSFDTFHLFTVWHNSLESISIVHPSGFPQVVDQVFTGVSSAIGIKCLPTQPGGDLIHLLVFKCLPQVVGDVEHDTLQEQHEGDPLVVCVNHLVEVLD